MSERAKSLVAALVGLALAVLFAELALRAYQRVAKGTPFFAFLPGYHETRFPLSPFLVFGPRVDWQIEGKQHPETAYFNSQGLRTRELLGPKPAGELRVFALGGSTTEDVWNEAGIHWPLVVERELHAAGRGDVRVYNGAMSAYTTAHSLVRLATDVLQYQPDLVLVMHNVNDLTVNYQAARLGRPVDASYLVKYGRKQYTGEIDESDVVLSRLWHSVRSRLAERFAPPIPPVPDAHDVAAGLALFRRNLVSLDAVARAHGAKLVLLTMPISRSPRLYELTTGVARRGRMDPLPPQERFLRDFDAYNESIREVGRERGIPVIDMAQRLPDEERYFADVVHTTTAGVEAFGKAAAPELLRLLPPPRTAQAAPGAPR